MLIIISFRDAEIGQIKMKMAEWNVLGVASGTIVNASVYFSEKLLR